MDSVKSSNVLGYITHLGVTRFTLHLNTFTKGHRNIFRGHDLKYDRPTIIKIGSWEMTEKEAKVYEILNGIEGIPKLYTWCAHSKETDAGYLSMQRCGMNLASYIRTNGLLSLKDALRIATVVANTLSTAHGMGVIHCDIKPEDIVCSPDGGIKTPVVIDWGLAAVTRKSVGGVTGHTPGFASVSSLRRNVPHALDDLESLIYVVEYLVRGCLPRSHLMGATGDDYSAILELQEPWVPENATLREFLRYTRDRRGDCPVDYEHLRGLFLRASDDEPE